MPIDPTKKEERYFIGSNTSEGFIGYHDRIFKDIKKLYIIKGAPGTGKSNLMRNIANEAENRSLPVKYYYCSSDPSSIDGIVIEKLSIGIIDGTAPHTRDPIYPGIYDEIINLGDFWDKKILKNQTEDVLKLNNEKKQLFDASYHLMSARDIILCRKWKLQNYMFNKEKMRSVISRLFAKTKTGEKFEMIPCQLESFGMNGHVTFNTFEEMAEKRIYIKDKRDAAHIFLNEVIDHIKKLQLSVLVSYDPTNGMSLSELYIPSTKTAFLTRSVGNDTDKIINTERFLIREVLRESRATVSFYTKLVSALNDGISQNFSKIKDTHFALEKIYIDAMDFKRKEDFTKKLLIKLFSEEQTVE